MWYDWDPETDEITPLCGDLESFLDKVHNSAEFRDKINRPNIHVAKDNVGFFWVSTVFLKLDHGMRMRDDPNYKPVLFETMVFERDPVTGEADCHVEFEQVRACTSGEARRNHDSMVEKYRQKMKYDRRLH
jgi:hypothetical protein